MCLGMLKLHPLHVKNVESNLRSGKIPFIPRDLGMVPTTYLPINLHLFLVKMLSLLFLYVFATRSDERFIIFKTNLRGDFRDCDRFSHSARNQC